MKEVNHNQSPAIKNNRVLSHSKANYGALRHRIIRNHWYCPTAFTRKVFVMRAMGLNALLSTDLFAVLLLASPLLATAAYADWQYTKWGMSPQEVIAKSAGAARQMTDAEANGRVIWNRYYAKVTGDYTASGIKYEAVFYFDQSGLALVQLYPGSSTEAHRTVAILKNVCNAPRPR
jgi:uncharacterized MAPEG superfamily protein